MELALCVLQDVALNGLARLGSLELELVDAKSGGKSVAIKDSFATEEGEPTDESFLRDIDEAVFNFRDSLGKSPDVRIAAGQGLRPPYSPPDGEWNFVTPVKSARRSLGVHFQPPIPVVGERSQRSIPPPGVPPQVCIFLHTLEFQIRYIRQFANLSSLNARKMRIKFLSCINDTWVECSPFFPRLSISFKLNCSYSSPIQIAQPIAGSQSRQYSVRS